jgi:hypothetical protein
MTVPYKWSSTNLLFLPKSKQTDTRDLNNFEPHTRDVTLGLSTSTKARNKDLVILVYKVQATIILQRMF